MCRCSWCFQLLVTAKRTAAFSAAVMPPYSLINAVYAHKARRAVAQTSHADELAAHDGRAEPLARCDGQRHIFMNEM